MWIPLKGFRLPFPSNKRRRVTTLGPRWGRSLRSTIIFVSYLPESDNPFAIVVGMPLRPKRYNKWWMPSSGFLLAPKSTFWPPLCEDVKANIAKNYWQLAKPDLFGLVLMETFGISGNQLIYINNESIPLRLWLIDSSSSQRPG